MPVFLKAMYAMHHFQPKLTEEGIREVILNSDKQRFEISKGWIQVLYGHSFPTQVVKTEAIPPDILYHSTANRFLNSIKEKGLLPMGKQYVHLSADVAIAFQVGLRRDHHPAILKIDAKQASDDGIIFYIGNDKVWLADRITPQ